jgi:sugar phosphate permease
VTTAPAEGKPRLFRGWPIVAVAFVGQSFGIAPLLVYTFGVFAKPLAEAFHSSRGSIALAVSLLDVIIGLSAAAAGWLVDRHGARGVITGSILALTGCLVALAYVQPPLWHLYSLYALAGLIGVASSPVTYGRVVANWFDRKRGLALGLASAGIGFGAFVTPILAQFLLDRGGWRVAYLGLGGTGLLIALPAVGLWLRGTPQEVGLLPDGGPKPDQPAPTAGPVAGLTAREAIRTRTFWQLCIIFFCVAACVNGSIAHIVPLLTDHGVSGSTAALATSLFGLTSILGRVGNGYLVDRIFAPRVVAVLFAGAAVGVALLLADTSSATASAAAALLGLAVGAESDVIPFLISRYFGMRAMAMLYGCAFGAYVLGNATGRYLIAAGYDATGSYTLPLDCTLGLLVLASVATLTLGRYDLVRAEESSGIATRAG